MFLCHGHNRARLVINFAPFQDGRIFELIHYRAAAPIPQTIETPFSRIMKIRQKIDPIFARKFRRHLRFEGFLYEIPALLRVFRRIGATFSSVENGVRRHEKKLAFRREASAEEHGYIDRFDDIRAAINYASGVDSPDFGPEQPGEHWLLYKQQISTLGPLLSDAPGLFNFGVCYAYIDSLLAKEFPNREFVGIDLSPPNAAFNGIEFAARKNMTFLCGDIFPTMQDNDYSG